MKLSIYQLVVLWIISLIYKKLNSNEGEGSLIGITLVGIAEILEGKGKK